MVTEAEREDLIQDAKAFRTSHEMTFQLLSDGDNQPPREVD
jgi:peroxiredoxin